MSDNINDLPDDLKLEKFSVKSNNEWIIFGGIHSNYNWMSNYYSSDVTYNDICHSSVEHAYQYTKAITFQDVTSAKQILGALTPADAKRFGMNVRGFQAKHWDTKKKDVLLEILRQKFGDETKLAQLLKSTIGKSLAEAGRSKTFAIGMSINNKDIFDTKKWPHNCNLLGKCLMEVRSEL